MDDTVRLNKEAFVSGLSGTSMCEANSICLVVPISALASSTVSVLSHNACQTLPPSIAQLIRLLHYVTDFVLVVLSALVACCYPEFLYQLFGTLVAISILAMFLNYLVVSRTSSTKSIICTADIISTRSLPLTRIRSGLLLLTSVAILAVDFHLFPRRLAKTEWFGTGLMDVGVGAFVFVAAFVDPVARFSVEGMLKRLTPPSDPPSPPPAPSDVPWARVLHSCATQFSASLRHAWPLLLLGLLRPAAGALLNYQLHASEYGTHWTFFLSSVALTAIFACINVIIDLSVFAAARASARWPATPRVRQAIAVALLGASGAALAAYERWLQQPYADPLPGLPAGPRRAFHWVLHGARGGWLEANREGLLTLLAYAAISAAAVAVKYAADAAQEAAYASKAPARAVKGPLRLSRAPLRIVGLLLGLTCVCAVVAWAAGAWALPLGDAALQSLVEGQAAPGTLLPVSRRLGNTAFVSWIVGLCSLLLAMAHAPAALGLPLLTATDAAPAAEPLLCGPVLALVNRHALLSFLAANLLTGAVNLSVDTMGVRDGAAMVVLVGYLGCVCAVLLAKEYYDSSRLRIKEKQR